jgi:hypothetical protein
MMKTTVRAIVALSLAFVGMAFYSAKGDEKVDTRVFELRTYTAKPGKIDELHARFRDHTLKLFEKHHMTVIGFWKQPMRSRQNKSSSISWHSPARKQRQRVGRIFRLTQSGRL